MARVNTTITVAAGTPVQLCATPIPITYIKAQMRNGSTGRGYVMAGILGTRVPAAANPTDVTQEMEVASATSPGVMWEETDLQAGMIGSQIWFDGSHTGDTIVVTYKTPS